MEAVIVLCFVWLAMILGEFAYWLAIGLARWLPVIIAGVVAAWIAHSLGGTELQAASVAIAASLAVRHLWRRCF